MHRYFYFVPIIGILLFWYQMIKDGVSPPMYPLEHFAIFIWMTIQVWYIAGVFGFGPFG